MTKNLKRKLGFNVLVLTMVSLVGCTSPDVDRVGLESQAQDITRQFAATLLPTLQEALANGGPVRAIEVCSVRAPEIADELSAATSWSVRRVSLKARNSERAIPDSWEQSMLEQFEIKQKGGSAMDALNGSDIVNGEFRYMQAQLAMPLCLTCHGSNLSADVSAALREHYPNDVATGYIAGDIRGAISLRFPLD